MNVLHVFKGGYPPTVGRIEFHAKAAVLAALSERYHATASSPAQTPAPVPGS